MLNPMESQSELLDGKEQATIVRCDRVMLSWPPPLPTSFVDTYGVYLWSRGFDCIDMINPSQRVS